MQEYSGGLSTIWWLFNRYMSCLYRPSSNLNSLFLITTWKARFEFRILGFLMPYSYSYHPHSTFFFNAPPYPHSLPYPTLMGKLAHVHSESMRAYIIYYTLLFMDEFYVTDWLSQNASINFITCVAGLWLQ